MKMTRYFADGGSFDMAKKAKAKLVAVCVLAVLALIILLQNTETVDINILFFRLTLPRAILILLSTLLGFAAGLLVALFSSKKSSSISLVRGDRVRQRDGG
jgi:uncharacterized integral membrane protein